jgi:hypothetical protein
MMDLYLNNFVPKDKDCDERNKLDLKKKIF